MPQWLSRTFYRCQPGSPVLCLLHAFPVNSAMWEPQLAYFAGSRVSLVALDYPGFGESTPFDFEPEIDHYARRVADILDELNVARVTLAGLSMGGYVALACLRLYPERVNGLVLANTRAAADSEATRQRRRVLIEEIRSTGSLDALIAFHLKQFFTPDTQANRPELVTQVAKMMASATPQGVIHALQAMAGRPDSTELLKQCSIPVLVLTGQADPLIPVDEASAMAALAPNGRLRVLPDCAHLSNLEQPDRFNSELQAFLSEIW